MLAVAAVQGFNSTLVRLKVKRAFRINPPVPGFNSTLVRLKVSADGWHETETEPFQFHIGSIEGGQHGFVSTRLEKGFNSTLVRLKAPPMARLVWAAGVSIPHWFD